MPVYEITAPDGKVYEVSGKGSSEQALAHFKSTWKPAAPAAPAAPDPSLPEPVDAEEVAAAQPPPPKRGLLESAGRGAADLATGFAKLGTNVLAPFDLAADVVRKQPLGYSNRTRREKIEEFAKDYGAGNWTSIVNQAAPEIAATGKPMAAVEKVAAAAAPKILGMAASPTARRAVGIAADTGVNAAYSGAQTLAEGGSWEDAKKAALWGGAVPLGFRAGGTAAGAGWRAATRDITPEARRLMDAGIQVTPGQAYGGLVERAEEFGKYVPFLGRSIENAQDRVGSRVFQRSLDDALAPLNLDAPITAKGADGINRIEVAIDNAYNASVPRTFATTQDAMAAIQTMKGSAKHLPLLSRDNKALFNQYIERKLVPEMKRLGVNGNVEGRSMKDIDIDLGKQERKFKSSDQPDTQELGIAFEQLKLALRESLQGRDADALAELTASNRAFRNALPLKHAMERSLTPGRGGTPTPLQLRRSRQRFDQDTSRVEDAATDLASREPAAPLARLGTGIGMAAFLDPTTLIGGAAASGLYTRTGIRLQMAALGLPRDIQNRISRLPLQQQRAFIAQRMQGLPSQLTREISRDVAATTPGEEE